MASGQSKVHCITKTSSGESKKVSIKPGSDSIEKRRQLPLEIQAMMLPGNWKSPLDLVYDIRPKEQTFERTNESSEEVDEEQIFDAPKSNK